MSDPDDLTTESGIRFPISVKGVLLDDAGVVPLENERREWELPGGKLEVEVGPLIDAFVYEMLPEARVLVLTYGCLAEDLHGLSHSAEHSAVGLFGLDELEDIDLPRG